MPSYCRLLDQFFMDGSAAFSNPYDSIAAAQPTPGGFSDSPTASRLVFHERTRFQGSAISVFSFVGTIGPSRKAATLAVVSLHHGAGSGSAADAGSTPHRATFTT